MSQINFRQMLRELIFKKNISVAKLARKADLNHCTVYKYLREETEMTAANLESLFNILKSLPTRKEKGVQE